MFFLLLSLFFSSLLLALTHAALQDCTSPHHTLGTSLLFFLCPNGRMASTLLFLSPFLLFSLSHSSHQVTLNTSHLSWLCFNQFLFFSSSLAESPLPFASLFSFFLPTCLTSLTSHNHLCGLTFVHPFINVGGLLYIIIEEKMNPISSLLDKLLQQVQFALLTSCQFFYKLI